jgi:hypothetical protein
MKRLFRGILIVGACALSARAVAAQTTEELGPLIRQLLFGSLLEGGGDRDDMVFTAADSASAALLRLAEVPATAPPGPKPLLCPASTEADGRLVSSPVGYRIGIVLVDTTDTTTRELRVTKSCSFRYRGQLRPYAEGGAWTLRREGGRWRVAARLYLWET